MGTYQSKYTGAEIDALLDAVKNGGGSGTTKTTLFEGEATELNAYDLTDNVHNYDFVLVTCYQKTTGDKFRLSTTIVEPSLCPTPPSDNLTLPYWTVGTMDKTYEFYLQGNFSDGTKLNVTSINKTWTTTDRTCGICKVVGIKY